MLMNHNFCPIVWALMSFNWVDIIRNYRTVIIYSPWWFLRYSSVDTWLLVFQYCQRDKNKEMKKAIYLRMKWEKTEMWTISNIKDIISENNNSRHQQDINEQDRN